MLKSKEVEILLSPSNMNYYKNLGYKIPTYIDEWYKLRIKRGTKILVKVQDLKHGTNEKVIIQCDNCKKEFTKQYSKFLFHRKRSGRNTDYCNKCKGLSIAAKQKLTFEEVTNILNKYPLYKWIGEYPDYKNTSTKLLFKCPENHTFFASLDAIQNKGRIEICPECSRLFHRGGENHWNWQNGKTNYGQMIRHSMEYKNWRQDVFKRDKFTCQSCKEIGGKLEAHHKLNFSDYPELIVDLDNGITLCKKCHKKFHKRFTQFNNTIEQLETFLNTSKIYIHIKIYG